MFVPKQQTHGFRTFSALRCRYAVLPRKFRLAFYNVPRHQSRVGAYLHYLLVICRATSLGDAPVWIITSQNASTCRAPRMVCSPSITKVNVEIFRAKPSHLEIRWRGRCLCNKLVIFLRRIYLEKITWFGDTWIKIRWDGFCVRWESA